MAHFSVLPPEINSLRMYLGAGSAPMLQAAAAWDGLAAELGNRRVVVLLGDHGVNRAGVAGPGVGGDGRRGGAVCGLFDHSLGSSPAGCRAG